MGVFDTGGLQSITNVEVTNGNVQVGIDPTSPFNHLTFVPGQTGPLVLVAQRSNPSLPMYWSFDATDAAGNTSHCRGPGSLLVAVGDSYSTDEDTPLTVASPGVLGNDTDPRRHPDGRVAQ